jgi:hypothetical protein
MGIPEAGKANLSINYPMAKDERLGLNDHNCQCFCGVLNQQIRQHFSEQRPW